MTFDSIPYITSICLIAPSLYQGSSQRCQKEGRSTNTPPDSVCSCSTGTGQDLRSLPSPCRSRSFWRTCLLSSPGTSASPSSGPGPTGCRPAGPPGAGATDHSITFSVTLISNAVHVLVKVSIKCLYLCLLLFMELFIIQKSFMADFYVGSN